jgi:CubicO group peptidase (beta-lactamase class C family)
MIPSPTPGPRSKLSLVAAIAALLLPTPGGAVLGASTYTFGLGFAVRPSDGIAPVPGSAGDFNWGGYAGTIFWVDPKEQLAAVLMVQSGGALRVYHRTLFRQLVYQAIVD